MAADVVCRWCGEPQHKNAMTGRATGLYCPIVKALNFNDFGAVVRVEYFSPADFGTPSRSEPDEPAGGDYPKLGSDA